VNRYLLDTNVISEVRRRRPHGALLSWLGSQQVHHMFLSAVTIGELQLGVERTRQQDSAKANEIEFWIEQLIATYQVLPLDAACFREWGRIMHGKSGDLIEDAMIAATARVHDLIVATRNERDFEQLDVRIFNPFKAN